MSLNKPYKSYASHCDRNPALLSKPMTISRFESALFVLGLLFTAISLFIFTKAQFYIWCAGTIFIILSIIAYALRVYVKT